jgi:hypothetical protein
VHIIYVKQHTQLLKKLKYSAPFESGLSPLSKGALYGRLERETIPDAVTIQFRPPEVEHSIARNMSRILMQYMYYRIKELCIKLVIETS